MSDSVARKNRNLIQRCQHPVYQPNDDLEERGDLMQSCQSFEVPYSTEMITR
jgi:hypothetical protein